MIYSIQEHPIHFQYTMNNFPLSEVDRHPYLGVKLEQNMSWPQHITDTANKVISTLGFLCRNLSACSTQVKATAYKLLVRLKLEYASSVWHPHHRNKIKQLEKVQRKAAMSTSMANYLSTTRLYAHDVTISIPSYIMTPTMHTTRSLSKSMETHSDEHSM